MRRRRSRSLLLSQQYVMKPKRGHSKSVAGDQKPQQPIGEKGTQEASRKVEESKLKAQEEARQRPQKGTGATLLSQEDVGRVASLRNVMISEGGEVSGEVVNNSKQTLREVQLQILYSWRWNNEYHPGKNDPGTARYHVLNREIPSGQTARFDYKPSPPLASREDGQFDISVQGCRVCTGISRKVLKDSVSASAAELNFFHKDFFSGSV